MDGELQNVFNEQIRLWEIIVASCSFGIFFVDIHRLGEKMGLNFKPFNCASCLSAWMALFLLIFPQFISVVLVMFLSGVIAPNIRMMMDYLWNKSK